jgi:pimeloyl-ACP methyl ester carboxylesterase
MVVTSLAVTGAAGIVEERFVTIGGVQQWIGIRGEDRDNPVLLVLHGGPGFPCSIFTPLMRSWERHFTVVHWDRRGAGKTLGRNGKAGCGKLTFDGMIDEAIEVTNFLRKLLNQDKIVLMADSMGTMIGIPLVQRRPELFHAYVGTDQYVTMVRNEAQGYGMALARVREAGNTRAVAALEKIGADPTQWDPRGWNVKMQLTMQSDPVSPNAVVKLLLPLALTSPTHSLRDVFHLFRGFGYSKRQMFDEFMAYDARRYGTRFELPIYIFQGESDVVTLTSLAKEYLAEIDAPAKALVTIPNASHFAAFTQPEQFLSCLLTHLGQFPAPTTD